MNEARNPIGLALMVVVLATASGLASAAVTVERVLERRAGAWQVEQTPGARVYYEAGSRGERDHEAIVASVEAGIERSGTLLALRPASREPIHVFVVDRRESVHELTGRHSNATAFPTQRLVVQMSGVRAAHELFHVVAYEAWGKGPRWLNEGLAVYADDEWHGHPLHALALHLEGLGRLPTVEDLLRRFSRLDTKVSYPAAGSLAKFLYERFGREVVHATWRGERRALIRETGLDLDALDTAWREVVGKADSSGIDYAP